MKLKRGKVVNNISKDRIKMLRNNKIWKEQTIPKDWKVEIALHA